MPTATNTRVVPRSGCSMMRAIGAPVMASRTPSRRASRSWLKCAMAEASATITTTLASSEGCSWNGPSWNQAWAPLRSLPSPVTTISRSSITPT